MIDLLKLFWANNHLNKDMYLVHSVAHTRKLNNVVSVSEKLLNWGAMKLLFPMLMVSEHPNQAKLIIEELSDLFPLRG